MSILNDKRPDCRICQLEGHAKWHDYCHNGVVINPIALLQFIEKLPQTPEVGAIHAWVSYLSGIDMNEVRNGLE